MITMPCPTVEHCAWVPQISPVCVETSKGGVCWAQDSNGGDIATAPKLEVVGLDFVGDPGIPFPAESWRLADTATFRIVVANTGTAMLGGASTSLQSLNPAVTVTSGASSELAGMQPAQGGPFEGRYIWTDLHKIDATVQLTPSAGTLGPFSMRWNAQDSEGHTWSSDFSLRSLPKDNVPALLVRASRCSTVGWLSVSYVVVNAGIGGGKVSLTVSSPTAGVQLLTDPTECRDGWHPEGGVADHIDIQQDLPDTTLSYAARTIGAPFVYMCFPASFPRTGNTVEFDVELSDGVGQPRTQHLVEEVVPDANGSGNGCVYDQDFQ